MSKLRIDTLPPPLYNPRAQGPITDESLSMRPIVVVKPSQSVNRSRFCNTENYLLERGVNHRKYILAEAAREK